jgi:SOS-response transcriptional repressor LexA
MDEKDYKDILKILEDAGWQPQVCDTPIPVYESVHAGNPEEPGQIPPDMVLVPRAFLSMYPEAMVRVQGNSMIDRDIEDGDWVKMCYGRTPHDGDIVVVAIGSECTVKSYYEDEDGVGWLVPQNKREKEKYKVIRLDEDAGNVHLCGVVTDIRKPLPRVPDKAMKALVDEVKANYEEKPKVCEQRVRKIIGIIESEIKVARLWYAVYRPLIDVGTDCLEKDDFEGFCSLVRSVVPDHEHLPSVQEMQRMAVLSFSKPVKYWDVNDAPVGRGRFKAYMKIAERMFEFLED